MHKERNSFIYYFPFIIFLILIKFLLNPYSVSYKQDIYFLYYKIIFYDKIVILAYRAPLRTTLRTKIWKTIKTNNYRKVNHFFIFHTYAPLTSPPGCTLAQRYTLTENKNSYQALLFRNYVDGESRESWQPTVPLVEGLTEAGTAAYLDEKSRAIQFSSICPEPSSKFKA